MPNKYYSLTVNDQDSTADLYIFGDIVDEFDRALDEWWFEGGIGSVSGLSIVNDLEALDVDTINVHINSYGGLTSEGLAIYNTLKNHRAKVVTWCDGFACSAASIVFMAGDERVMGDASLLMIHNAWTSTCGNAAELRDQADVLDKISQGAANSYASCISLSREELDQLLDGPDHQGTWILPEEALEWGFCTAIAEPEEASAKPSQSVRKMLMQKLAAKEGIDAAPLETMSFEVTLDESKLREIAENVANEVLDKVRSGEVVFEGLDNDKPATSVAQKLFKMKKKEK